MSVIAWDGKTLAADKRASCGSYFRTTTKIFKHGMGLFGYAGEASAGEEVFAWFRDGHNADKFPTSQRDKDDYAGLLVVWDNGELWKYERTPFPLKYPPQQFAIGSGCDFALAAMYCGKTASEAVEVACQFNIWCGNGIDTLTHG